MVKRLIFDTKANTDANSNRSCFNFEQFSYITKIWKENLGSKGSQNFVKNSLASSLVVSLLHYEEKTCYFSHSKTELIRQTWSLSSFQMPFCDFFLNQFHNNLLSSNSSARSHSSKDNQVMFLFLSKVSIMMLLRHLKSWSCVNKWF